MNHLINVKALPFILLFSVFSNQRTLAQDSLLNLLQTELADTTRIDVLGALSTSLFATQIDTAIHYSKRAVDIADKINDVERKAYMLKNVGIGYYYKGEYVQTLDSWQSSLTAFESINHLKGISNLLGNIGAVYNSTGDYPKAIDYHLKSLRIAEQNKDDFRRATALQNIGAVHSNVEDFPLSKKYYEEALELCRNLEYKKGVATVVMNLSEVYRNTGDIDKSLDYINEAKEIFAELQDPILPEAMIAASQTYFMQNRFDKAIEEGQKAYALASTIDSKSFMQRSKVALGNAYNKTNKVDMAITSFKEAILLGQPIGVNLDLQQSYKGIKISYERQRNFKNALEAQDSLLSVTRELYDIDRNDKISNLQLEFDLEKRENEIALLSTDNELKNQKIQKAELQRNFFTAISMLLLLLIGGVGYLYKFAQKKNKIISNEKERSDWLLKNILPPETAEELKKNGVVKPKRHEFTTVLFTDFVNFTETSATCTGEELISSVDYYFKEFDRIVDKYDLEKIKTIGDAYMCAGGLHKADTNNALTATNTIKAASDIVHFVQEAAYNPPEGIVSFKIRIGIDSGPILAGVVGQAKFQYDIWGDTVNVASRMEFNSEPNKINVSENVYDILKDTMSFDYRGTMEVKNKGLMKMYFYA